MTDDDGKAVKKHRKRKSEDCYEDDYDRKMHKHHRKHSEHESDEDSQRRRKKSSKKSKKHKKHKKKSRRKAYTSSSSDGSVSEDQTEHTQLVNKRLIAKLEARGETLEERKERRTQKRAALITQKFGYTADENPFNDPNLHEKFSWKKRQESRPSVAEETAKKESTFDEIEKVRKRREQRDLQYQEMERIRAEENRMRELEHYDDWAKKEEEFHLRQQRQRSAIRLVEGREKPIDVLAKNILLFGLSNQEKKDRSSIKYQEKYNALDALETLEAELDEPDKLLKMLTLEELQETRQGIQTFLMLEREAIASIGPDSPVLRYWNALALIADDEIKLLKTDGKHQKMVDEVKDVFAGQSKEDLAKMREEVTSKLQDNEHDMDFDRSYWRLVRDQLEVHISKMILADIHARMLVSQLEKLEKRKEELAKNPEKQVEQRLSVDEEPTSVNSQPLGDVDKDLEQELGLADEVELSEKKYSWEAKYQPRKPRYFNRVKTGYDWNKYNQTHYDKDNPPPKTVQGYKFNIFYTDLIDPSKTPQFKLEQTDSDEFCILRFHAGPPYEDIAFKIINREWNRSRKRGYKCTFERGVLSLYFNFTTHWYRR